MLTSPSPSPSLLTLSCLCSSIPNSCRYMRSSRTCELWRSACARFSTGSRRHGQEPSITWCPITNTWSTKAVETNQPVLTCVCCLLVDACCLLFAVCCLLSAVCSLVLAFHCLLFAACCLLFAVCCLLSAQTAIGEHKLVPHHYHGWPKKRWRPTDLY